MDENNILEQLFEEDIDTSKWFILIKALINLNGLAKEDVENAIKRCKSKKGNLSNFKKCVKNTLRPTISTPPKQ